MQVDSMVAVENNELKIFVGNLPFTCDQLKLGKIFSRFGNIVGVNLRMDRNTNKPKGFGFVTFDQASSAVEAIEVMHGSNFEGRILSVGPAQNRGTGSLNSKAEEDEEWKTAPPTRKIKDQNDSILEGSKERKTKSKTAKESSRRSWNEWAGPVSKESSKASIQNEKVASGLVLNK